MTPVTRGTASLASMIRLLRRAGRDLRTVAVGADPVRPAHPRPLISTIVVVLVVGFTAIATQQLSDERDPPLILAAILGVVSALPLIVLWYQPLWAWRIGIIGLAIGGIDRRTTVCPMSASWDSVTAPIPRIRICTPADWPLRVSTAMTVTWYPAQPPWTRSPKSSPWKPVMCAATAPQPLGDKRIV